MYNRSFFETFRKAVTTAGTAEQLHTGLTIPDGFQLVVKALDGNAGDVEIGNSKANAESSRAFILRGGQSKGFYLNNANLIWIDVTTSGEGVICCVEQ